MSEAGGQATYILTNPMSYNSIRDITITVSVLKGAEPRDAGNGAWPKTGKPRSSLCLALAAESHSDKAVDSTVDTGWDREHACLLTGV